MSPSFIRVSLQNAEAIPSPIREELEQIVAAIQRWANKTLPIGSIPTDEITIDASQIVSGTLVPARGGTGVNGAAAADGYLLIGNGSGFTLAPLTEGTGIVITNTPGGIEIAADVQAVGPASYGHLTEDGSSAPPVDLYTEDGTDWLYADGE